MSDSKKRAEEDGFVDFGDFDSPAAPPPPPSADADFPFEDLPSPASARASGNAKPFDDFADLSGGGNDDDDDPFGSAADPVAETPRDDFGEEEEETSRRPQTLASARAADRVEPSFDDEPFEDAGTDEPSFDEREFNGQDGDELDESEEGDEPVAGQRDGGDRKHQLIRYAVLGGMGLAGLFVTWIGYSTVIKPFLGEQPAQVASGPMVPTGVQPSRPANTGTLPPLGAGPSATVPPPSAMPPRLPAPTPTPTPTPTAGLPPPSVPATPVTAPSAPQIPTAAPVRPAAVDPALADRLARVESQVQGLPSRTDMEQRIKQLEERLARYENRAAPAAPRPEVQVPMKPQVIDGWTLQGVNRDTAWLKGPNGIVEVREDSDLGGNAGKVTRIQRYQNSWIVVTTTGVIMRN